MKKLFAFALLLICLIGCTPTQKQVNDALSRGQLTLAAQRLAALINTGGELSQKRLDLILTGLTNNHGFNLDVADELMDRLKPDARPAIWPWYEDTYLKVAEAALKREQFDTARAIWKRHQQVRAQLYPRLREPTPVLGIIDLREADFRLRKGDKAGGRRLLASARKQLTLSKPFDRVGQYSFQQLVADAQKRAK